MKHDRQIARSTSAQGKAAIGQFAVLSSVVLLGVVALPVSASSPPPGPAADLPTEGSLPISNFRIQPVEGKIRVRVINETRVPVLYGLLGERQQLTLKKGEGVTLEALAIPSTITFYPETTNDRQYIQIRPELSDEPGEIQVKLIETRDLNANRHALVFHETGLFFTE
jgi:hypothetical protein